MTARLFNSWGCVNVITYFYNCVMDVSANRLNFDQE
jgi:hypothetical protein